MSLLWWLSAKKDTSHTFTICLCFLRRMKWLHYSLLCRCHSPSVLASPSLVSVLHTATALSSPEDVKFTVTSLFCSQWIPNCSCVIGGEAVKSSAFPSPRPHQLCLSSSLPQYESPSARTNESKRGPAVFSGAKFISSEDRAQAGIMSRLPGTIGNADRSGATVKSSL